MNYAVYLLESALRDELKALGSAEAYLEGCPRSTRKTAYKGETYHGATHSAFCQSRDLARERIPQLRIAITAITGNPKIILTDARAKLAQDKKENH